MVLRFKTSEKWPHSPHFVVNLSGRICSIKQYNIYILILVGIVTIETESISIMPVDNLTKSNLLERNMSVGNSSIGKTPSCDEETKWLRDLQKTKLEVLDRKKIFGRNHKNYRHYNLLFLLLLWLWLWVAYRHPPTRYHASLLIVCLPPIKQVYLHQIKFLTSPPFYQRGVKMNIF